MNPQIVDRESWDKARLELLAAEKDLTRARDKLSEKRREMPWVRLEKRYVFEAGDGPVQMTELFDGCQQLMVYHFMFGPDWAEGCPSCSFWADNLDGVSAHLRARDMNLVLISRAPFAQLDAYRQRMGWNLPWYSSLNSEFNYDFGVSFTEEQREAGNMTYNYRQQTFPSGEAPGISAFILQDSGDIFHSYSTYGRGLDMVNGAYHLMDLAPKGRDESALSYPMAWLRRSDQYEDGE